MESELYEVFIEDAGNYGPDDREILNYNAISVEDARTKAEAYIAAARSVNHFTTDAKIVDIRKREKKLTQQAVRMIYIN